MAKNSCENLNPPKLRINKRPDCAQTTAAFLLKRNTRISKPFS